MNDLNADIPSTIIDNDAPVPSGAEYRPEAEVAAVEPDKPMSLEDAVKQAAAETKENAEKTDPKPKVEAKDEKAVKEEAKPEKAVPERGDNGKFTAKPKAEPEPATAEKLVDGGDVEQEQGGKRPSEGRDADRAPAQFLPRAKEKWGTVDPDIRSEVKRMEEEFQRGKASYEEDREFRKSIRTFEDMAKQAGTSVPAALENYVRIDQELRSNPENGMKQILHSIGLTPEQYAQHVMGKAQQQQQNPALAQTSALQQQVQALTQQIERLTQGTQQDRETTRISELERSVIIPFASEPEHSRYAELQDDIVFFLNSGKIPSNMTERQRLEHAYDMAVRLNPDAAYESEERLKPASNDRPLNPAGSKSVKGSLSYGAEVPRKSAKLSLDEAIKMAARSVNG